MIGELVGPYRLVEHLGGGGMGVVYLAEETGAVKRWVAIKLIKLGMDTELVVRRFEAERQALAVMEHPGIAKVFGAGSTASGRPYFAMELVPGLPITRYCDENQLEPRRRIDLFLQVCEAVQHAHQKGIIHRDLKPSNLLVAERDGAAAPKVIDFGVAKAIGTPLAERTLHTLPGQVVGTLGYVAPEQLRADAFECDTRSDVYSLGVVLYELLVGALPFESVPSPSSDPESWRRFVQHDPPRPSARWTAIEPSSTELARARGGDRASVSRQLRGDLDWIVMKAIDRELARRYATPLALADDLRHWLAHEPVEARPPSRFYRARKFVRRNRALSAALAGVALALVAGLVVSLVFEARAERSAELARAKTEDVLRLSALEDLDDLIAEADRLWPAEPSMLPRYESWLERARRLVEGDPGDPSAGTKPRPSLAEHEAKLAELRRSALPADPRELEADRRSSPDFESWAGASAQLQWMRRMLGEDAWPDPSEVEAALAKEELPKSAEELNALAWPLVDVAPERVVYGGEPRGLALARRALAAAGEAPPATVLDTLAWALYRTGRFEDALDAGARAVDAADESNRDRYVDHVAALEQAIAEWSAANRAARAEEARRLAERVSELERRVGERRTFDFADSESRWWHGQLAKLVSNLKDFVDEEAGGLFTTGTSPRHGWGVPRRAEFAREIEERSVTGEDARARWVEAIRSIASSPAYGGLELEPQLGLSPIGADPASGLWEFAHLETGEPARRSADGRLILTEATGIVFVLIPGGRFRMGAQRTDPNAPNYDPRAQENELPVHEVELSPYFLSKYEMTQSQWIGFTANNPSAHGPGNYSRSWDRKGEGWTGLHPIEQVSWNECREVLARLGLSLPSEAQWERAARGGTDTPYWTGADLASLAGAANVADAYGKAHGGEAWDVYESDFDDGNTVHAVVGTYRANPFGLCEVHGNVWEWCLDGFESYASGRATDPVVPLGKTGVVARGGSFNDNAYLARVALRLGYLPEHRRDILGVRPARAVTVGTER